MHPLIQQSHFPWQGHMQIFRRFRSARRYHLFHLYRQRRLYHRHLFHPSKILTMHPLIQQSHFPWQGRMHLFRLDHLHRLYHLFHLHHQYPLDLVDLVMRHQNRMVGTFLHPRYRTIHRSLPAMHHPIHCQMLVIGYRCLFVLCS